jgi:hypothetical protein
MRSGAALAVIVVIALAFNAGHFWRCQGMYGRPLSTEGGLFVNQDHSAAALAGNTLRNIALHLGTPLKPINRLEDRALQAVLGKQLDNPKTTWPGTTFQISCRLHEDAAGNLIHAAAIAGALLFLPWGFRKWLPAHAVWYGAGIAAGAVLFCFILKWQPWSSRLHLALFALASPLLAGAWAPSEAGLRKRLGIALLLCMGVYSLPFALRSESRPLLSRAWLLGDRPAAYFANRPELRADYAGAIDALKAEGAKEVGLYIAEDDWEYPFWALADRRAGGDGPMFFTHVGVTNISRSAADGHPAPKHLVATHNLALWEDAPAYTPIYTSEHATVFRRTSPDAQTPPR